MRPSPSHPLPSRDIGLPWGSSVWGPQGQPEQGARALWPPQWNPNSAPKKFMPKDSRVPRRYHLATKGIFRNQAPWRLSCCPQNSLHLWPQPPFDDGKTILKTGKPLVRVTQQVSGATKGNAGVLAAEPLALTHGTCRGLLGLLSGTQTDVVPLAPGATVMPAVCRDGFCAL